MTQTGGLKTVARAALVALIALSLTVAPARSQTGGTAQGEDQQAAALRQSAEKFARSVKAAVTHGTGRTDLEERVVQKARRLTTEARSIWNTLQMAPPFAAARVQSTRRDLVRVRDLCRWSIRAVRGTRPAVRTAAVSSTEAAPVMADSTVTAALPAVAPVSEVSTPIQANQGAPALPDPSPAPLDDTSRLVVRGQNLPLTLEGLNSAEFTGGSVKYLAVQMTAGSGGRRIAVDGFFYADKLASLEGQERCIAMNPTVFPAVGRFQDSLRAYVGPAHATVRYHAREVRVKILKITPGHIEMSLEGTLAADDDAHEPLVIGASTVRVPRAVEGQEMAAAPVN